MHINVRVSKGANTRERLFHSGSVGPDCETATWRAFMLFVLKQPYRIPLLLIGGTATQLHVKRHNPQLAGGGRCRSELSEVSELG